MEDDLLKVPLRAAGCPNFEVQLSQSATVAELKIAATAGFEMDPEVMKVIFKGKVLKDGDVLIDCGVDGRTPVMLARGARPAPATAVGTESAAAGYPEAPAPQPIHALPGGSDGAVLRVTLKGPGGLETTVEAPSAEEPLGAVRARAATLCGLEVDEVILMHRGKILKVDGSTLRSCSIAAGDVVRVAKRATQDPAAAAASTTAPVRAETFVPMGSAAPMPAAWGPATLGGLLNADEIRRAAEAAAPFLQGVDPEEARQAAMELGAQLGGQRLRAQAAQAAAPAQVPWEVRIGREVRAMGHQVRLLAAQRRREEALGPRARDIPLQAEDLLDEEEDPELLDEIARTMAEARARGAPVPNPAFFVDRALNRARQARALGERLDREASGMDPELADALEAAERTTSAVARAPKRLGGGGSAPPGSAQ